MSRPRWMYGVEGQTPGARLLLALLWSYADLGARTAFVWPSVATLTELLGQTERSTRRQLESLARAHLIERASRQMPNGEATGWVLRTPERVTEASLLWTETSGHEMPNPDRDVRDPDTPPDRGVTQTGPRRHSNMTETSGVRRIDGAIDGAAERAASLSYGSADPVLDAFNRARATSVGPTQIGRPYDAACDRFNRGELTAEQIEQMIHAWACDKPPKPTLGELFWGSTWAESAARYLPGFRQRDPDDLPLYTSKGASA